MNSLGLYRFRNVYVLFYLIFATMSWSCRSDSDLSAVPSSEMGSWLYEVHPKDRMSVVPETFEVYVTIGFKPVLENVKFLVWREGRFMSGKIVSEKVGNLYKIEYELVDRGEGTYLAYFAYGDRVTFWSFFAEVTRTIPIFDKLSLPKYGYKNFPFGSSIVVSEEKLMNFMTIDEETVVLRKKFLSEGFEVPYEVSFSPNYILINLLNYEPSRTYELEITGVTFFEDNPEFSHSSLVFRTIDTDRPYVKSCSPAFCVQTGQCILVDSIRTFEILFDENEELDPISVLENFVVEENGLREQIGELWSIGGVSELILRNPHGTAKLYVFPNRIYFDLGRTVEKQARISIYILPRLSDTSGNSIDRFLSWCIDVE